MSELRYQTDAERELAWGRSVAEAMRESLAADAERHKAESAEREARRRRPRPSQDASRYATPGGQAVYRSTVSQPPIELVSAVSELAKLHEAWQSENARGAELDAQLGAAQVARISLFDGRDGDGNLRRRSGVSVDDVDAAELREREAEQATQRQGKRSLAALKAFDDAAHAPELRPIRERLMALSPSTLTSA